MDAWKVFPFWWKISPCPCKNIMIFKCHFLLKGNKVHRREGGIQGCHLLSCQEALGAQQSVLGAAVTGQADFTQSVTGSWRASESHLGQPCKSQGPSSSSWKWNSKHLPCLSCTSSKTESPSSWRNVSLHNFRSWRLEGWLLCNPWWNNRTVVIGRC